MMAATTYAHGFFLNPRSLDQKINMSTRIPTVTITPFVTNAINLDDMTVDIQDGPVTAKLFINKEIFVEKDEKATCSDSIIVTIARIEIIGFVRKVVDMISGQRTMKRCVFVDGTPYVNLTEIFTAENGKVVINPGDVMAPITISQPSDGRVGGLVLAAVDETTNDMIAKGVNEFLKKYLVPSIGVKVSITPTDHINEMLQDSKSLYVGDNEHTLELTKGYRVADVYDDGFVELITKPFVITRIKHYDDCRSRVESIYSVEKINVIKEQDDADEKELTKKYTDRTIIVQHR